MSSSELKYLIAVSELCKSKGDVRLADIAEKLGVSKVSVYKAMERLEAKDYVARKGKGFISTQEGERALCEYMRIVNFLKMHLQVHCNTPEDVAYNDALEVACAFSDTSRKGVADFLSGFAVYTKDDMANFRKDFKI